MRARSAGWHGVEPSRCSRGARASDHPIGLAAGLDKDAEAVGGLFALGFARGRGRDGHAAAAARQPAARLFRLPGAPGAHQPDGLQQPRRDGRPPGGCASSTWRPGPVGVNIGKNKDTPLRARGRRLRRLRRRARPARGLRGRQRQLARTRPGLRAAAGARARSTRCCARCAAG